MNPSEIKHIIETGKLKGYVVTGGFLDVYWHTPELKDNMYWLFKFTSVTHHLKPRQKDSNVGTN